MKIDVSRGKMITRYNLNGNRKQRRYKSHGIIGSNRMSMSEAIRNYKRHNTSADKENNENER